MNPEEFQRIRLLARGLYLGDEADDVVQDLALARLEGARQGGTDSYVRQSLRYGLLSRVRADHRRRQREAAYAAIDRAPDQREVATIALALREALLRLSDEQRSLLEARFVEGREPSEIADALAISPEAARQRIHRALARLQAEFDETAPQKRRGLLWLGFGDRGRRRRLALVAGLTATLAIPIALLSTCGPEEPETVAPDVHAAGAVVEDTEQPANEPADPGTLPAEPATLVERPPAPVPDRLGASVLLREYKLSYAVIAREVQGSFIECLTEHNQTPPGDDAAPLSGRSEFRVSLQHDPETGTFVDDVEVVVDEASARELATCVRESLPSIRLEDPELVTPKVFRVVLDLDRKIAFAKAELDLSGLPQSLRDDAERLDTLGRWLGREEPPAELRDAVAELAAALADGVISQGELAPTTLEALASVE